MAADHTCSWGTQWCWVAPWWIGWVKSKWAADGRVERSWEVLEERDLEPRRLKCVGGGYKFPWETFMKEIKVLSFQITLQLQIESHVNLMDMKRRCTTSTKSKANWSCLLRKFNGVMTNYYYHAKSKTKKIVVCWGGSLMRWHACMLREIT
jgi:hypothetical protein